MRSAGPSERYLVVSYKQPRAPAIGSAVGTQDHDRASSPQADPLLTHDYSECRKFGASVPGLTAYGHRMDYTELPVSECLLGNDGDMLCFALDRVRKEFAWKTGGLDAVQLRQRLPSSTMTLAGLIKHMAFVEDWFTAVAQGRPAGQLQEQHAAEDRDVWQSALFDEPDALYAMWYGAIGRSRAASTEMITNGGLDAIVRGSRPGMEQESTQGPGRLAGREPDPSRSR